MMWNSFVTSYRFILKSKTFTAINLIGLTAGLTASFFLFIYIINELSYNSFYQNNNRIFRIIREVSGVKIPLSPALLTSNLQSHISGIEKTGKIIFLPLQVGPIPVKQNDNFVEENGFICADPEILEILSIQVFSRYDANEQLDSNSVILSESAALRCFGTKNPVGRQLGINISGIPFSPTVTGVFRDLPWNSTIQIDYIASMDLFRSLMLEFVIDLDSEVDAFEDAYAESYLLIDRSSRAGEIQAQIPALLDSLGHTDADVNYRFQNIGDIYLDSPDIVNDFHLKGDRDSLFYYASLAIFILLLAGINYSILSTARSALRFKEVGVRKVLGATKRVLRMQILIESMMLTFLAFPLSFLVLGLVEPFMDNLYGYKIQLYTWNMLIYIPLFAGITLLIGFVSGAYLALYLSALNPLKAIKNQIFTRQRFSMSKVFIVFQLLITLSLLICVIIILAQLDYCLHENTGIDKRNLLTVSFDPEEFHDYTKLRDKTRKEKSVIAVSGSSIMPPSNARTSIPIALSDTLEQPISAETYYVDEGFLETLGVEIVAGKGIHASDADSISTPTVLNQDFVVQVKLTDPVNTSLGQFKIMGIVRDFNIHSFYSKINPALFIYAPDKCRYMVVRFQPGTLNETVDGIQQHWEELAPGMPFQYTTFNDALSNMYDQEQKFGQVVSLFALLAFIITGMGLFGLALLISERRMKETAIRKVFGASNVDILFRMQKEFLVYIGIASLIAVPATWILMNYWLSTFYYKTGMHWYLFVISIVSVTIFVSAIILMRTYRVLHQNLINALRYE
ncbi:MAG: ABC transporter permease [Bacteroidales bacterium]|nr:ABC transporter permease [Bacteroidota bacterium]MBL6950078.1 ABC transporter permease [Bacteroidales bacterium]